jgi:hypothetical protein
MTMLLLLLFLIGKYVSKGTLCLKKIYIYIKKNIYIFLSLETANMSFITLKIIYMPITLNVKLFVHVVKEAK